MARNLQVVNELNTAAQAVGDQMGMPAHLHYPLIR